MSIDPYGSGYRSPPSIDSFQKPILDPLESDLKRFEQKRNQDKYYRESISSYHDLSPLALNLPNKLGVDNLSNQGNNNNKITTENELGFLDKITSFFDSVYTYFWGSPLDESPGSPISGNPKLASPGQLGLSQASMERLAQAMAEMNKALERIQEVTKEENTQSTSAEETMAMFMFLAILKRQSELKKEAALINGEAIHSLHQATRMDHEKRKDLQTTMDEAMESAETAGKVVTGANIGLGVFGVAQIGVTIATALGVAINPAFAVAASFMSIALLATKGASTLVKTNYDKASTKHKNEIQTLSHRREQRTVLTKDHSLDIKQANHGVTAAANDAAEVIKRSKRVKQALAQF